MSSRLSLAEAEYIVADCGARTLIVSASLSAVGEALAARLPKLQDKFAVGGAIDGFAAWEETCSAMPLTPIADQSAGRDMLYSSGTTGKPKGIKTELSSEAYDAPTALMTLAEKLYGLGPDVVYLSPAPLYHAAPLRFNMTVIRCGGTTVIMEHFDAAEYLRLVERHRITHSQLVPTMFVRMLKLPEAERARHDLSSLKVAIHAAAPCPVQVKEAMIGWWGPVLFEYYAGSEGNGYVACNSAEWLAHKGTVGRALMGEVKIVAEDGETVLGAGEANVGTIYFAGGNVFEYHNDPDKTAASRNAAGWSTLGDVGYLDQDGYLFLTDRKAFMIISGGVNIYPQEIESLLINHPAVYDVAVFGVPNDDFGEEVKAVVQPARWQDAGGRLGDELMAFCRANLSHVKCPRSIDFERELPRHPTGKLYKRLLRDKYWKGRASRIV